MAMVSPYTVTSVPAGSANAAAVAASAAAARYAASQGVSLGTTSRTPDAIGGAAESSPAGISASPGMYTLWLH